MTRMNRRTFSVSAFAAATLGLPALGEEKSTERKVYLTLDDGPHPQHTKTILDVLKAAGAKATFFVLGVNVERYGVDLLKRAVDEGHCIGNHTYAHKDLTKLNAGQVREEIVRCERSIRDFLPTKKLFRPPYGATNAAVEAVVRDLGYESRFWTVDTADWSREFQPDRWVRHGLDQIPNHEQAVVLAHDIHRTTAEHFDEFVKGIQEFPGATFATCGSL